MNSNFKDLIISTYDSQYDLINKKISDFEKIIARNESKEIFHEMVFCILAAGTSAKLAETASEILKEDDFFIKANEKEIVSKLKKCYRFYNVRGKYIIQTREFIISQYDFNFKKLFNSFDDNISLRNFIATNKAFKGLGMKASSHFLRNIGYSCLAILDFHILDIMREHKLIKFNLKSINKKKYLHIEKILRNFSKEIKIDLARLDLILWYLKTGTIIK